MKISRQISRKNFLRYLLYLIGIPLIYSWKKLVDSQDLIHNETKIVNLPANVPYGASVNDEILIYKNENSINFFSSRCSHLGCKINKFDSQGFICPCHGSHFSFNGEVMDGPAYKPLKKLSYKIDKMSNSISITVNEQG